ncbi:alpha/beta fold hydrolase [Chitinophaga niabensis]|uniref:alpha/beta fold hydrolase n=1 Tax=Chitinophaga niabensis TaxID=536979 RepID=UPI0031BAE6F5
MKKQVLFIHGGGDDGYGEDAKLAASLQKELGDDYEITYPQMPSIDDSPDFGWLKQIEEEISRLKDGAFWVGHSLGASMLLKYLSENKVQKKAAGIFLIAPPFWHGKEEWKQGLKLQKDFAENLPKAFPIFVYYCLDDEVVPQDQFATYKQQMPWATFREIESGGHQLDNNLTPVSTDIKSL